LCLSSSYVRIESGDLENLGIEERILKLFVVVFYAVVQLCERGTTLISYKTVLICIYLMFCLRVPNL
jgi:hypothetical protein